jgi:phenylacetic acid degradation operon negative regulatory protein
MDNYLAKIKKFLDSDTTEAKITKVALGVVALASLPGIVLLAAGMGNAVQVFSMFKKSKKYSKSQIKSAMTNLHRQKLIEYISDKKGVTMVRITVKGMTRLKSFAIDLIQIPKPKQWNGKWQLVMFDLPIRFTKARNSLRFKLKQLGFIQFQKSVWIYPYPCLDEILFVADYYKIGKYVEILEVSNLLNEEKFKKSFGL